MDADQWGLDGKSASCAADVRPVADGEPDARIPALDPWSLRLPLSGWVLRIAKGDGRRPALEVYSPSGLVDVSVSMGIGQGMLRGAHRGSRDGRVWSMAWGQIPSSAKPVRMPESETETETETESESELEPRLGDFRVVFRRRRQEHVTTPVRIHGRFWVTEVEGRFRSVAISAGPALVTARLTSG